MRFRVRRKIKEFCISISNNACNVELAALKGTLAVLRSAPTGRDHHTNDRK
jgi:hypothetical protein